MIYEFGAFRLDTEKHRLLRDGEIVSLTPKALETLRVLVERRDQIVERDELMKTIWPDVAVEDGNLSVAVSTIRKALNEDKGEKFIETVPRQGYRFLAEVRQIEAESDVVVVEKYRKSQITIDEHIGLSAKVGDKLFWPKGTLVKFAGISAIVLVAVAVFGYFAKTRSSRGAGNKIQTLAVLPFKSINSPAEDPHQGLGMSDILITRLSNLRAITVRPTAAVMSYENTSEDIPTIGAKLNVDAVLQGTVYNQNNKVRVTVQLIRVTDQAPIWASHFEKELKDQFQLQDEIALQIVDALALKLTGTEHGALTRRYTENAEAYQLYLKGRYHWNKRSFDGLSQAEHLFRKAVEADSNFALAYVGLADSLLFDNPSPGPDSYLAKALAIDPNLAEAYASRGFLHAIHWWKWKEAEESFKKSIELNPNYATAHQWYGMLLGIEGRYDEAKAEMQRAIDIDPTSYNFLADMGQIYYFTHEYDKARAYCNKALKVFPDFNFAHQYLAEVHLLTGNYESYVTELQLAALSRNATPANPTFPDEIKQKATGQELEDYRRLGIRRYLEHLFETERSNTVNMKNSNAYYGEAKMYSFLGEKARALDSLERAYEARAFLMPWTKSEPMFDNLRSEPRFQAILQRMNLHEVR